MTQYKDVIIAYSIMLILILAVGIFQSWNIAVSILNFCLISAVMTMGANIQWGYAGLINFGIMGYTALGGLAAVLISVDPIQEAWRAGGFDILMCLWLIIVIVLVIRFIVKNFQKSKLRSYSAPTIPLPIQILSAKLWSDERHVNKSRLLALYNNYKKIKPYQHS